MDDHCIDCWQFPDLSVSDLPSTKRVRQDLQMLGLKAQTRESRGSLLLLSRSKRGEDKIGKRVVGLSVGQEPRVIWGLYK